MQPVKIECLEPAAFTFPSYVKSVGMIDSFNSHPYDSAFITLYEKLNGFFEINPKFNQLKLIHSNKLPGTFPDWPLIKEQCINDTIDAQLYFNIFDYQHFYREHFNSFNYISSVERQISCYAELLILDPYQEKIIDKKMFGKTKTWQYQSDWFFQDFPDSQYALSIFMDDLAYDIATYLTPFWELKERTLFVTNNQIFKNAFAAADTGNWEKAILLWKQVPEESKWLPKIYYNLAVAHEVINDYESALMYANKAIELRFKPAYAYKKILEERLSSFQTLNKQL